jgi:hypothetical protein
VATSSTFTDWDLVFEGRDVFTNGGVSGPGSDGALSPLDPAIFDTGELSDLLFLREDTASGPFTTWYKFDEPTHPLWSRYHVYGLRDGNRYYKLQIPSYYGEVGGAPVSALYRLRYTQVSPSGMGSTTTLDRVDTTSEGVSTLGDTLGACFDLATDELRVLTVIERGKLGRLAPVLSP